MSKQTKEAVKVHKLTTVFLNTDAVSNGDFSHHDAWIKREVIVTSGESFYEEEIDRIALGATVYVYANRVGVVAAGTVLDSRSTRVSDAAHRVSPEPLEYQRKVSWFADIARNPVSYTTVKELCGTPSRAVRSIVKGKAALLEIFLQHAREAGIKAVETRYADDATEASAWTLTRLRQGK